MYKEPFSAYPTAKIMVVTNNPPHFKDVSDGIWRRLLLIPFDSVVPEKDRVKDLAAKLIATELPGILAWALEGARKLEKYNGFKIPEKCKQLLVDYKEMAQPEMRFLEENFERFEGSDEDRDDWSIECRMFWAKYKSWCNEENISPKGNKTVLAAVKKFVPFFERKRDKGGSPRVYRYRGLVLKEVENVNVGGSDKFSY
jgi:putative DNA primase/helicase